MLLNTVSTYQQLQSFKSIEEMNQAVTYYKKLHRSSLTKSTFAVLDLISQYACKFIGVCYLSQRKMALALDISYKTVQRAINTLVELDVITKRYSKRENGDKRQSSNILVINPLNDQPECPAIETPLLNSKSINTDDTKTTDSNNKASKDSLIKKGLVNKLPKALQVLSYFFDVDDLYKLSGTIYKAKASVDKSIQIEEHDQEYYQSILSVINAYKRNKIGNLQACLFVAIRNVTKTIWIKNRAMSVFGL